jgi:hypothetical protein
MFGEGMDELACRWALEQVVDTTEVVGFVAGFVARTSGAHLSTGREIVATWVRRGASCGTL